MVAKKVDRKRRVRKNIEAGITHIYSTFNNIIIIITDTHGNALTRSSASSLGLKRNKKSTPLAAQTAVEAATRATMEHGLKTTEVTVKGPGSGHEAVIRSLQTTGLKVAAIRDMAPVPHNSAHPPKRRRIQ